MLAGCAALAADVLFTATDMHSSAAKGWRFLLLSCQDSSILTEKETGGKDTDLAPITPQFLPK